MSLAETPASTYPQIDISGFKKWEHKEVSVDPNRNYFAGLTQLGGYYPTFSGGPWQERLQLRILGQLSQDLSVTYDLDQQPETPERFDVKVKYQNNELTFGDLNANFSGNEFVSASKFLNGVMLTGKESWYDVVVVPSAKLKSQTQSLTSQKGNNTRGPYNLGHGSIVESSEQIQLNNLPLRRNIDYTIDYFEGKITFNRILDQTDEFKYSFEYTNVLDLFFPTLSKRDFIGLQSRFTIDPEQFGKPAPKEEPVISSGREIFPSAGSVESLVQEEESSGLYHLKNVPIINFSEAITFMGTTLKKNDDYLVRYDTGEIKLLTRFLPSSEEALTVEYRYYQTSSETEAIAGIGSRGPYHTSHRNLVPESERIEVDGKLFVRNLDYKIKADHGELQFGVVIGPTSQIKISYRYSVTALPQVARSKFPKELKLGATLLRESAKKAAGAPTASVIEAFSGQSLIANNFLMNLKNRPVLPTSEAALTVSLKSGGTVRLLTQEVDYTVPRVTINPGTGLAVVSPEVALAYITDRTDPTDGYGMGTIYLLNQSILASDEVDVTYSYDKSIVGRYSGIGNGSKGPYFLRNTRQIVPGSETVQAWDQGSSVITTYTRNTSFDTLAGETGYSINYNADNPSITFNNLLATTKNFQIIYQYVPATAATGGDISQAAFGFDGSFKIGDIFKVDSSYARSETDQVFVSEPTIESFSGNGTKSYALHSSSNIIEGSEKILVNQKLLNRDIDYFITYNSPGQFNFYYITPATIDAISVEYNFQSITGSQAETKLKTDSAYRLGAETKLFGNILTINGSTKKIGFDFSPLGGTAIGVGSDYQEYNLNFAPPIQSFYTNYSYKFNKTPLGASHLNFLRSYDNSISTGINPGGLAKLDLSYRNFSTLDDPLSPGALHNSDNLQDSYSGSLSPADWQRGALSLNQKYDFRKTVSKSDVVDQGASRSTQNISYYHAGSSLKFTDRVSLGYDYQYNEPITTGSLETETSHTQSLDNAYNLSVDLTAGFLQKWLARVSVLNHTDYNIVPAPVTSATTKNETYHVDLTPFTMLTTSLDHNRQERTSYVAGGENPLSLRTNGTARLTPVAWLSGGINASKSETIPETGSANKNTGRTIGYDVDYAPITFQKVKLTSHFASSDQRQTAPMGTEQVTTRTNTFSQNYTLTLNPLPILPLTVGLIQENYKNNNDSRTTPVTTETSNQTLTASTNLVLPILPQLSLNADYTRKTTMNVLSGASRPKTLVNGKASYQVVSWGTLNYEMGIERNQGEVLAGSIADLNYKKTTQTISLNIVIPANNPVLQNFTVVASLKQVDYKNYTNASGTDDFSARLVSFEGTLNF